MATYRFTGTRLVRDSGQTTLTEGDLVEDPTDAELDAFGDLLTPVDTTGGGSDVDGAGGIEPPFDPTGVTVATLRSNLDDNDYSPAELDALHAAEEAGESRETALDAIDAEREG
ncbi:hypothetical protein J2752_000449 [Halarchaeum rubridurum]|nr:hypothetical protein [Halarchaeum rubridurum]MBP1953568.1 hypothetical protein [Halarchaeum rubridurum]